MPVRRRVAVIALGCALAAAPALAVGCGGPATPLAATIQNCGTTRTAANVPVEIKVDRGQVTCPTALQVEAGYAKAIEEGKAPGNGGGGPVRIDGWTCLGLATPQLLKTGETSKCVKDGHEIVAVLKTPS
jgi:hypothetical protein